MLSDRSRDILVSSPIGLRSAARSRTDSTLIHMLLSTPGSGRVGVVMSPPQALDSGSRNAHKTPAISVCCAHPLSLQHKDLGGVRLKRTEIMDEVRAGGRALERLFY